MSYQHSHAATAAGPLCCTFRVLPLALQSWPCRRFLALLLGRKASHRAYTPNFFCTLPSAQLASCLLDESAETLSSLLSNEVLLCEDKTLQVQHNGPAAVAA